MQPEDLGYLTAGLRAPGRDDRLSALEALLRHASQGDRLAQQALRDIVADYRQADPEIYARALNRIEWFGNASLAGALLAALADGDYGCQAWTAAACGTLGVVAAEPLLVALLRHPDGLATASTSGPLPPRRWPESATTKHGTPCGRPCRPGSSTVSATWPVRWPASAPKSRSGSWP